MSGCNEEIKVQVLEKKEVSAHISIVIKVEISKMYNIMKKYRKEKNYMPQNPKQ